MKLKLLVLLLVLLGVSCSRKHLKEVGKTEEVEKKTVVQSNHFFSNYQTFTNYDVNSVEKGKSLILLLKKGDKDEKALTQNPISITLNSGQTKEICQFKTQKNLCAIKNIEQTDMKMRLQCKKAPCQLSWVILQPGALTKDGEHEVDHLVQINKDYDHATIVVRCNDPNVKTFAEDLKLYTNSQYQTINNNGIIYYLFNNQKSGFYFLTSDNIAAKKCAKVSLRHSLDIVEFNKKDMQIQDFILPGKTNTYQLSNNPSTDFRVDSFFHTAKVNAVNKHSGIQIALIGDKNGKNETMQTITVDSQNGKNTVDFSAVFKKPNESYKKLFIELKSKGDQILVITMEFSSSQRQQVNLGQTSFFTLKKDQKINFKLVGEAEQKNQSKKTFIVSSDASKFVTNVTDCLTKQGCEFTIEAKQDGSGHIYFGEAHQQAGDGQQSAGDGHAQAVKEQVSIQIDKAITKKIRDGQSFLFKKVIKAKTVIQAVVNSPNVLIYAAKKAKCARPSNQCHQKVLNSNNPVIFQQKQQVQMFFLVQGLDSCQFTLTLIDQNTEFIQLQDSKPFTYLFDDSEKDMLFHFKLTKKQDVNFNLIGPVGQLNLVVYNTKKLNKNQEGDVSTDGYISVSSNQVSQLDFIVKIQKREQFKDKYIHFTILVSTKQGNVRLQPGLAHYETIPPQETRDYVFQFQPKKDILLNFYTHNIKEGVNLKIIVSTTDQYKDKQETVQYIIDTESQMLDIRKVADQLCEQKLQNCQLFVRMVNEMNVELDVTVTLLIKDSIIELKDGIWNSYHINSIAKTSHFYFLPKHQNKSVTILYKSQMIDLKLMYSIWKTDDQSINPSEWPFPNKVAIDPTKSNQFAYRPTQFIHIDNEALKKCWPNCVILVSTFQDDKSLKNTYNTYLQDSQFKIMASNNYVEIPQKLKVDVALKKDENKHLLVDLKYALDKDAITFFTYFTIGSVLLSGNVYDQSNPRCPNGEQSSDFRFGNLQTQISIQTIKKKLQENQINTDKNPYICILAQAFQDSKFSIEYTTDNEIIKQLILDSFYIVKSTAQQTTLLQLDASQQFTLKVTRTEGYPYITTKMCKESKEKKDDFQVCLDEFKEDDGKKNQIADKMTSFTDKPCQKCLFFVKVYSDEPSEINFHVQSKYAQTQLIENSMLTDQIEKQEENKYLITSIKNEQVIINIQITHGDLEVEVNDFDQVNIKKTNDKGKTNIHITIPPKKKQDKKDSFGNTFFNMFDFSTFNTFHLSIKLVDKKSNGIYTITYSSGDPEVFLQDGLITQYVLMPNRTTKFLYKNPNLSKIYLHLSMLDAALLNKLNVKILAINDESDQDSGVQITPQKPNFKKKTPNPTMIMELPANKFYQIQIKNNENTYQMLTLGINNQQIIYLPFDHEFPIQLKKSQYIFLVINVPFITNVIIQLKKCDESALSFAYTLDYDSFIKQQFSYQQQMGEEELLSQVMIKSKNSGSIYFKITSPAEEDSLLTVKAFVNFMKTKPEKAKAGGKGLLEYSLLDSQTAQITFAPLVCPSTLKSCYKDFAYSSLSSSRVEDVYAQLVCSSFSFDLDDRQIIKPVQTTAISAASAKGDKIIFKQILKGDESFIGVKAINNKTGDIIYYKPVEIVTIWGQVSKHAKGRSLIMGLGIFVSLCAILICYRRSKRHNNVSEYAPLSGMQ